MAAVYEAQDTTLDRAVALKVLPAEFLHDRTFARRFETEARLIAKLEHQNIVPIYATGIEAGIPWMSMRLLTGKTLGAVIEQRRLEQWEVVRLLRQVAAALDYAHAFGIVHRDIKPANILLDGSGTACVADFGLAQMIGAGSGLTQTGMLTGTPHYMAPEQALGKPVDHRSDIYSLGIVAYEMLTGTIPFSAPSPVAVLLQHVHEALPAPPDRLSPRLWIDAVRKAAAKDPDARWVSAGAFVEALEMSIGAAPHHTDDGKPSLRRRALSRPTLIWTAAAGGAVVIAVGLASVVLRRPAVVLPEATTSAAVERQGAVAPPTGAAPVVETNVGGDAALDVKPRTNRTSNLPGARRSPADILPPGPPTPLPSRDTAALDSTDTSRTPVPAKLPETPLVVEPLTDLPGVAAPPPRAPDVFTTPQIIREVKAVYPQAAVAADLQGEVVLEGVVGVDGRVREIAVKRSTHSLFNEAARKAWLQYEYEPARRNGTPEPARILSPLFEFKLRR
jgi:serine/threonine-protein kinase